MLEPGQKIRIKWKSKKTIRLIVDGMLDEEVFDKDTEDDVFIKEIRNDVFTLRFPDNSLGDVHRNWFTVRKKK